MAYLEIWARGHLHSHVRLCAFVTHIKTLCYVMLCYVESLKMAPFGISHMSSYLCSIVTMAVSSIISQTKRDISWKSRFFFIPTCIGRPC